MQLYKYMRVERALGCLPENGHGRLRATPPTELNDPYECFVRRLHPDRERDLSDEQLVSLLRSICPDHAFGSNAIIEARKKYGNKYERELFVRQLSYRYGIVSFSAVPFQPLMWSHYAGGGSGFAVGYDADRLREALKPMALRKVQYAKKPVYWDYTATQMFRDLAITIMCCKSTLWKYEQEWRLFVELKDTTEADPMGSDGTSIPVNLVSIPNDGVGTVYFSERTPKDAVEEVENRLASAHNGYVNARLRKAALAEEKFAYEPESGQDG